ncbi:hypothetical protein Pelo_17597 [Pelomyxa schiedti]|nr:hypothetical protein Pelo_17597 [Pelomyxa schiedti]
MAASTTDIRLSHAQGHDRVPSLCSLASRVAVCSVDRVITAMVHEHRLPYPSTSASASSAAAPTAKRSPPRLAASVPAPHSAVALATHASSRSAAVANCGTETETETGTGTGTGIRATKTIQREVNLLGVLHDAVVCGARGGLSCKSALCENHSFFLGNATERLVDCSVEMNAITNTTTNTTMTTSNAAAATTTTTTTTATTSSRSSRGIRNGDGVGGTSMVSCFVRLSYALQMYWGPLRCIVVWRASCSWRDPLGDSEVSDRKNDLNTCQNVCEGVPLSSDSRFQAEGASDKGIVTNEKGALSNAVASGAQSSSCNLPDVPTPSQAKRPRLSHNTNATMCEKSPGTPCQLQPIVSSTPWDHLPALSHCCRNTFASSISAQRVFFELDLRGNIPNLQDFLPTLSQITNTFNMLQVDGSLITDTGMAQLCEILKDSLLSVSASNCSKISDNSIVDLSNCPNLTELCLSGCTSITDFTVEVICTNCRALKRLDISHCENITDAAIKEKPSGETTVGLSGLTYLSLAWDDICSALGNIPKICPFLEVLNLCGTSLKDRRLSKLLNALTNLTELDLSWCNRVFRKDRALKCFGKIRTLSIGGTDINDSLLSELLNHIPELEYLSISFCKHVTGSTLITDLSHCPSLKVLETLDCCLNEETINQVRMSFPGIKIIWSPVPVYSNAAFDDALIL